MNTCINLNKRTVIFFLLLICLSSIKAHASLLVSPTRLVFEERDRVKEVILINTSNKSHTYRIEWEDKYASDTGGYEEEYDQSLFEKSAQQYLRFSPRQVRLKPGERQIVKVMARRNSATGDDEYRSHLKFVVIPDPTEERDPSITGIRMRLDLFFNYSMPVLLRIGEPQVDVKIVDASLKVNEVSDKTELIVTISRKGKSSFLGNLRLINKHNGTQSIVGRLNDIRLFPEHDVYKRRIILTEELQDLQGEFEIRLQGDKEFSNYPIQVHAFQP